VGKIKEMKLEKGVRDTVLGAVERLEKVNFSAVFCCGWELKVRWTSPKTPKSSSSSLEMQSD